MNKNSSSVPAQDKKELSSKELISSDTSFIPFVLLGIYLIKKILCGVLIDHTSSLLSKIFYKDSKSASRSYIRALEDPRMAMGLPHQDTFKNNISFILLLVSNLAYVFEFSKLIDFSKSGCTKEEEPVKKDQFYSVFLLDYIINGLGLAIDLFLCINGMPASLTLCLFIIRTSQFNFKLSPFLTVFSLLYTWIYSATTTAYLKQYLARLLPKTYGVHFISKYMPLGLPYTKNINTKYLLHLENDTLSENLSKIGSYGV